jgi:hypothetical protein
LKVKKEALFLYPELPGNTIVIIKDRADPGPFLGIGMVIKGALKTVGDDILKVVGADGKSIQGQAIFLAKACVGDKAVVGAKGDRKFLFEHPPE